MFYNSRIISPKTLAISCVLLSNGYGVSIWSNGNILENGQYWQLHNIRNVIGKSELYDANWLHWQIYVSYIYHNPISN